MQNSNSKFGFYSALLLAILTIITFGFAMMAVPPSGPYCQGECMSYPFPDILSYYPRDYYWMYLAIFQLFAFLIFMVSNHFAAPAEKKIYSSVSLSFALISTTVLLIAYFTQFAVVPISVMKGESEGIALLTQYNGHGLFIALEELGYICMSISFLFLAGIFSKKERLERAIRIILISQFFLTIISFLFYFLKFGIDRDYRFEVAIISINWMVIIIIGIMSAIFFRSSIKSTG